MRIATVYFERHKNYRKFLNAFKNSAKCYMPNSKIDIIKIDTPPKVDMDDHKKDTAEAFIAACMYCFANKKEVAISDVDMMFVRSIEDVWKHDFDIAITTRNHSMKYNTGLWFFRPTVNGIYFLKRWLRHTKNLLKHFEKNFEFIWRGWGGIDQASLHMAIEENKKAKILELPCAEWNSTQSEWKDINTETRVIHIKSKLGLIAKGRKKIPEDQPYLEEIVNKWKGFANAKNTK